MTATIAEPEHFEVARAERREPTVRRAGMSATARLYPHDSPARNGLSPFFSISSIFRPVGRIAYEYRLKTPGWVLVLKS